MPSRQYVLTSVLHFLFLRIHVNKYQPVGSELRTNMALSIFDIFVDLRAPVVRLFCHILFQHLSILKEAQSKTETVVMHLPDLLP